MTSSLGNHEFNYGLDYLNKVIEKRISRLLTLNVYKDDHDDKEENDENYFKPYHILKKEVVDEAGQNK